VQDLNRLNLNTKPIELRAEFLAQELSSVLALWQDFISTPFAAKFGSGFLPVYFWEGVLFLAYAVPGHDVAEDRSEGQGGLPLTLDEFLGFELTRSPSNLAERLTVKKVILVSCQAQALAEVWQKITQVSESTRTSTPTTKLKVSSGFRGPHPPMVPEPGAALATHPKTLKETNSADDQNLWVKMMTYYEGAMVVGLRNHKIYPVEAPSEELKSAAFELDITNPNPFRIVLRTRKPYHGYLMKSTVADFFFKWTNKNQYPENFTVCPIQHEENVIGFLCAWGGREQSYQPKALEMVENLASSLAHLPGLPKTTPITTRTKAS
jgi:hypothetical protein